MVRFYGKYGWYCYSVTSNLINHFFFSLFSWKTSIAGQRPPPKISTRDRSPRIQCFRAIFAKSSVRLVGPNYATSSGSWSPLKALLPQMPSVLRAVPSPLPLPYGWRYLLLWIRLRDPVNFLVGHEIMMMTMMQWIIWLSAPQSQVADSGYLRASVCRVHSLCVTYIRHQSLHAY